MPVSCLACALCENRDGVLTFPGLEQPLAQGGVKQSLPEGREGGDGDGEASLELGLHFMAGGARFRAGGPWDSGLGGTRRSLDEPWQLTFWLLSAHPTPTQKPFVPLKLTSVTSWALLWVLDTCGRPAAPRRPDVSFFCVQGVRLLLEVPCLACEAVPGAPEHRGVAWQAPRKGRGSCLARKPRIAVIPSAINSRFSNTQCVVRCCLCLPEHTLTLRVNSKSREGGTLEEGLDSSSAHCLELGYSGDVRKSSDQDHTRGDSCLLHHTAPDRQQSGGTRDGRRDPDARDVNYERMHSIGQDCSAARVLGQDVLPVPPAPIYKTRFTRHSPPRVPRKFNETFSAGSDA